MSGCNVKRNICKFVEPTFERTCRRTSNTAHWSLTFEHECERAKHAAQGSACECHNGRATHASSLESLHSNVSANATQTHSHWNVTCERINERTSDVSSLDSFQSCQNQILQSLHQSNPHQMCSITYHICIKTIISNFHASKLIYSH